MKIVKRTVFLGLGLMLTMSFVHAQQQPQAIDRIEHEQLPYVVADGKVDRSTFLGWRVFHSTCYVCHGVDATGTSVAPDLVERVATMAFTDFAVAVLFRYPIIVGTEPVAGDDLNEIREAFLEDIRQHESGELRMPTWDSDPNVKPHLADLYGYLRARADGALGEGRPPQLETP